MTKQYAPGVAEQLAAVPADVPAIPAAPPAPRFIGDKSRSTEIVLDWPLEFGGVEYRSIVLRRLTVDEVARFLERIKDQPEDAKFTFPVFRRADDDGEIPQVVLDTLDDDDMTRLNAAAVAFLPRRFGGDPARPTIPSTGATTAP